MEATSREGWRVLVGEPQGGHFPIAAYSEFMPAPRIGAKPYDGCDPAVLSSVDPYGWRISEAEELVELRPGFESVVAQVLDAVVRLGRGEDCHHLAGPHGSNLDGNPYWPPELAAMAGKLPHERFVLLLPLALSRTQDDKGRVRWSLLGGSELGPERAFWASFWSAPGVAIPDAEAEAFILRLLREAYGESAPDGSPLAALGLRVLPSLPNELFPNWSSAPLPAWASGLLLDDSADPAGVRYLLTFRPFGELPAALRQRYLDGALHLLPCPGSLVFWGSPGYLHLASALPAAIQIHLLRTVVRHRIPGGLRVSQSGWIHEPKPGHAASNIHPELLRETFKRTNRWDRIRRHQDELATISREDKVARVLFSTDLEAMGLYDKPMARNAQIWDELFDLVLDGPSADREALQRAADRLAGGGLFGYRFRYPPMRLGDSEVVWHRPAVAFLGHDSQQPAVIHDGPTGYLTASPAKGEAAPVDLWPRLERRPAYVAAISAYSHLDGHDHEQTTLSALNVLRASDDLGGGPLPPAFVRQLLRIPHAQTLSEWLESLAARASDPVQGGLVQEEVRRRIAADGSQPETSLTFASTATRGFEVAFWREIASLAHGQYRTKDNADCVLDPITQGVLDHHHRDLDELGDYLLTRHQRAIAAAGMEGRALCGSLPFGWVTDFDFPSFGGWRKSQAGKEAERNVLVMIPGRNRAEAVVLADHYDTAYMEDVFDTSRGGSGARLAARGADDNHSATACLLLAAPIFLQLAKEGRLERDVWLLHLTGEEFPSDCLGARHFSQALLERTLALTLQDGSSVDLSGTRVKGVVVMDMIAHNRDDVRDVFQIAPGATRDAMRLALQAHLANATWNALAPSWNALPQRRGQPRSQRTADPDTVPPVAPHLPLDGEVRPHDDPHSSLYNTDGQIFSDVGVPVVLLMENYDIRRSGYHDTKDTMENIDLDYGSALAAIAIETVARVATAVRP